MIDHSDDHLIDCLNEHIRGSFDRPFWLLPFLSIQTIIITIVWRIIWTSEFFTSDCTFMHSTLLHYCCRATDFLLTFSIVFCFYCTDNVVGPRRNTNQYKVDSLLFVQQILFDFTVACGGWRMHPQTPTTSQLLLINIWISRNNAAVGLFWCDKQTTRLINGLVLDIELWCQRKQTQKIPLFPCPTMF